MSASNDDFPRPPKWLVKSQRINLRMATPAIIHLARRLQIVAFEREGGGYSDSKGDPDLGGPFAPAPLYLEMAITLCQKPHLAGPLIEAIEKRND